MPMDDWSSDGCYSDLTATAILTTICHGISKHAAPTITASSAAARMPERLSADFVHRGPRRSARRSEERRVGKAWCSTCRSRWWLDHSKKHSKDIETRGTRDYEATATGIVIVSVH